MDIYEILYNTFGPQKWWPAETRFEICVGAILTQGVSWNNVEKAISALKENDLLDPLSLKNEPDKNIADLIKPALYYNIKARKLKEFIKYLLDKYNGNFDLMFERPLSLLRREILKVWGIGDETADSILLYAGEYRTFVVDAYTRRIFSRIDIISFDDKYEAIQKLISKNIPQDAQVYNEYHALIVNLGKSICKKKKPKCEICPIGNKCIGQP